MARSPHASVGIDFGTTNSSIALVTPDARVQLARFSFMEQLTDSYRSLLYFERSQLPGPRSIHCWTGPEGIERYLAADTKGRLIQSLKSFLSSRDLQTTNVLGRTRSIEQLIARILGDLRSA